jgi:ABC-type uncharacterized transport system involved in gliding motility auxiliary subunit
MRTVLRQMNYDVRELGGDQWLSSGVPGDATVVIMVGPRKPLLEYEVAALHRYLRGGGRMIVFLDPEPGEDFAAFLGPFGLKFNPVRLANDKSYVRITYTPADRQYIYSNRFSSHPSVSTLTRNSHRLATVLLGAGYLEEVPSTAGDKPQVQFTIHSMPGTWNDANANLVFDSGSEKRKEYELAAVVTQKVKGADKKKKDKDKDKKKKGAQQDEARLLVVADSDCMSDRVFRNAGNGYLLIDALKWMGGEEEVMGETTSEEDVRLVHTRKKDQIWFYLTIFGVPALVLAGGLVYTRRRRRRS